MKSILKTLCITTLLVLTQPGCAESVSIGEQNTNVTVNVGDTMSIERTSSSSVGFSWYLTGIAPEGIVAFESSQRKPDASGRKGFVGAPTFTTYTFRAAQPGEATITFIKNFRGKWQDTYQVQVTVNAHE
jgi:predicted secreted protein